MHLFPMVSLTHCSRKTDPLQRTLLLVKMLILVWPSMVTSIGFFFDHSGDFIPGEYVVGVLAEVFLSKEKGDDYS